MAKMVIIFSEIVKTFSLMVIMNISLFLNAWTQLTNYFHMIFFPSLRQTMAALH
jgi:hypothetical protein